MPPTPTEAKTRTALAVFIHNNTQKTSKGKSICCRHLFHVVVRYSYCHGNLKLKKMQPIFFIYSHSLLYHTNPIYVCLPPLPFLPPTARLMSPPLPLPPSSSFHTLNLCLLPLLSLHVGWITAIAFTLLSTAIHLPNSADSASTAHPTKKQVRGEDQAVAAFTIFDTYISLVLIKSSIFHRRVERILKVLLLQFKAKKLQSNILSSLRLGKVQHRFLLLSELEKPFLCASRTFAYTVRTIFFPSHSVFKLHWPHPSYSPPPLLPPLSSCFPNISLLTHFRA